MGALGLIAPELSEEYGGQGASKVAARVIHEQIASAGLSMSYISLLGSLWPQGGRWQRWVRRCAARPEDRACCPGLGAQRQEDVDVGGWIGRHSGDISAYWRQWSPRDDGLVDLAEGRRDHCDPFRLSWSTNSRSRTRKRLCSGHPWLDTTRTLTATWGANHLAWMCLPSGAR